MNTQNKTKLQTIFHRLSLVALAVIVSSQLAACGFLSRQPTASHSGSASGVVRAAASQVGKASYRSGGASPGKGFDCSGLVYWAYKKNGIKVPRITTDQARAGRAVPKNQARPGDIMVFRTRESQRGLHTGLYAGGNSFIHSPRKGQKVRKESMQPYWGKRLVAVRRVVR